MPSRALLRVVDFERLLTAQAILAESLDAAVQSRGADADEARTLRAGFNLLAKVLFTRRAGIQDVHDLAWLDHLVVAKEAAPFQLWEGSAIPEAWRSPAVSHGRLAELLPSGHASSWSEVALHGAPIGSVKMERGVAGSLRVGLVTFEGCLELMAEASPTNPHPRDVAAVLREVWRLAMAARQEAREGCTLVFAVSP